MYLTLNQARLPFRHADMVCEEATAPLWNATKGKRFTFGTFATPVIHTTGASTEFAPLAEIYRLATFRRHVNRVSASVHCVFLANFFVSLLFSSISQASPESRMGHGICLWQSNARNLAEGEGADPPCPFRLRFSRPTQLPFCQPSRNLKAIGHIVKPQVYLSRFRKHLHPPG